MCNKFKPRIGHLLRSWPMDPLLPGVSQTPVEIAGEFKISSRMCNKFKPQRWAFAAILANGSVVTWGEPDSGGNCTGVQDQLKNVQQIQATKSAFAAILANGSVVTWGHPRYGGDCSAVQDQLKNVQLVQATSEAFAAILANGSAVSWGDPRRGGGAALQFRISSRMCNKFKPRLGHLLRSWSMDPSLPGVIQAMVVD